MSNSKYTNMFQFVRNILSTYVKNIRNTLGDNGKKLLTLVNYTETRITTEFDQLNTYADNTENNINNELNNLTTTIGTIYNPVNTVTQTHVNDRNNPHAVTFSQIAAISMYQPTSGQGSNGDVWVEYL